MSDIMIMKKVPQPKVAQILTRVGRATKYVDVKLLTSKLGRHKK